MAWRRHVIQAKTREFYRISSFSRLKYSSSSLGLTMTFWDALSLQYSATSFVFKYTLHKKTFKKTEGKLSCFFFPQKRFGNVNVLDQRNILANEKLKDKYITGKTWTLSFMVTCIQTRFALQASSVKTEMMANVSKHLSVYRASVLEGHWIWS